MKKTTIVIPNYNGIAYLENCMESLYAQINTDFDVIVVDNASTDGSMEIISKKFPMAGCIYFDTNTGFSAAVNAGIKTATTEYVLLLNNDTVVHEKFVQELEAIMDQNPNCFSASAKMLDMKHRIMLDGAGDLYCALGWAFARGKGMEETKFNTQQEIFSACAGAAIYRRNIFDEIGFFDENHFAYLEDLDIGYRALIHGYYNLFAPKARVYHAGSAVSGSRYNEFKINLSSQNSIYLIGKNMPILQILLNLPFLLVGFFVKSLFFIKKGYGRTYLKGLRKGFALLLSEQGKEYKVRFQTKNLRNYCKIQLFLWVNIFRRLNNGI